MNFTVLFLAISTAQGLPPGLLDAVCFVESSHNPALIHKDDGKGSSLGLCQIKYETAKLMGFRGTVKDLMQPRTNAFYAGKYLKYQYFRYRDWAKAITAYNAGHCISRGGSDYLARVFNYWVSAEAQGWRSVAGGGN